MHISTRRLILGTAFATLLSAGMSGPVLAQSDFPNRPVTIVVPFPPGGFADAAARRLSAMLSAMWKVPVVVDSRPGAGSLLGAGVVANAPADGYKILYTLPYTLSITKAARQSVPGFDPIADLQPQMLVAVSSVFVVPGNSPHKTFKEFMDYARKNPGKVNFAIQGVGSLFHLAIEQLKAASGTDITAVPYQGAAPALVDLLAGRVDGLMVSNAVVAPYLVSRKLRVLAMASNQRIPQMPDIPTIAESGFPGFDLPNAIGIFVRTGTPPAIIDKINTDVRKATLDPAMVEWMAEQGAVVSPFNPAQFKAQMASDVETYRGLIDKAGIKF